MNRDAEEGQLLRELDFRTKCNMHHGGNPCDRPAIYLLTLHNCSQPAGRRAAVCNVTLVAINALPYPLACETCEAPFSTARDVAWNIEPL